jgi:hypothetical protein
LPSRWLAVIFSLSSDRFRTWHAVWLSDMPLLGALVPPAAIEVGNFIVRSAPISSVRGPRHADPPRPAADVAGVGRHAGGGVGFAWCAPASTSCINMSARSPATGRRAT